MYGERRNSFKYFEKAVRESLTSWTRRCGHWDTSWAALQKIELKSLNTPQRLKRINKQSENSINQGFYRINFIIKH
jgi:hypothetical protein